MNILFSYWLTNKAVSAKRQAGRIVGLPDQENAGERNAERESWVICCVADREQEVWVSLVSEDHVEIHRLMEMG